MRDQWTFVHSFGFVLSEIDGEGFKKNDW